MIRRRTRPTTHPSARVPAFNDVVEWVLSLPWVVERPRDLRWPKVRRFEIDCPPLDRRGMFLMTGGAPPVPDCESSGIDLAAVMPVAVSGEVEAAGWEVHWTSSPSDYILMTLARDVVHERQDIEAFVLAAYSHAMA